MTEKRMPALRRWFSLLGGYDFFISYSRSDASAYAKALAGELEESDFVVFLDRREVDIGEELGALTRAASRSRVLVVVASPGVAASAWVPQEVLAAERKGRRILPIDVGKTLEEGRGGRALQDVVNTRIWRKEGIHCLVEGPSGDVTRELVRSYASKKRKNLFTQVMVSIALALAVLTGATGIYAYRESRARRLSEQRLEVSRATIRVLVEQVRGFVDVPGPHARLRREEMLTRAADSLKSLGDILSEQGRPTSLSVEMFRMAGDLHLERGHTDASVTSYARALDHADRVRPDPGGRPELELEVARTLLALGRIDIDRGESVVGASRIKRALELGQVNGHAEIVVSCLEELGDVHQARGESKLALAKYESGLEHLADARLAGVSVTSLMQENRLLERMANVKQVLKDFDSAELHLSDHLKVARKAIAALPDSPRTRNLLAGSLLKVAMARHQRGDLTDARDLFVEAIELYAGLEQEDPKNEIAVRCYTDALGKWAAYFTTDTEHDLSEAIEGLKRLVDFDPTSQSRRLLLAETLRNAAFVHQTKDLERAREAFSEAAEICDTLLAEDPASARFGLAASFCHQALVPVLNLLQQRREASPHARIAIEIVADLAMEQGLSADILDCYVTARMVATEMGVALEDLPFTLDDLIESMETEGGAERWGRSLAVCYGERGQARLSDDEEAGLTDLGRAIEIQRELSRSRDPLDGMILAAMLGQRATVQSARSRFEDARRDLVEGLAALDVIAESMVGGMNQPVALLRGELESKLAEIEQERGRTPAAREAWERAIEAVAAVAEGSPELAKNVERYRLGLARLESAEGAHNRSASLFREAWTDRSPDSRWSFDDLATAIVDAAQVAETQLKGPARERWLDQGAEWLREARRVGTGMAEALEELLADPRLRPMFERVGTGDDR